MNKCGSQNGIDDVCSLPEGHAGWHRAGTLTAALANWPSEDKGPSCLIKHANPKLGFICILPAGHAGEHAFSADDVMATWSGGVRQKSIEELKDDVVAAAYAWRDSQAHDDDVRLHDLAQALDALDERK